jgi:hypothetical protein
VLEKEKENNSTSRRIFATPINTYSWYFACHSPGMNFTRKLMLISPETLEKLRTTVPSSNTLDSIDQQMSHILNQKNISDHDKWTMYEQVLQKYLHKVNRAREPIEIPIVTDDRRPMSHVSTDLPLQNTTVSSVGGKSPLSGKATALMEILSNCQHISWDDRGMVSIGGQLILGSNIIDLLNDVVKTGKHSSPQGWEEFGHLLASLNVPREFIANNNRWHFIQTLKGIRDPSVKRKAENHIWPHESFQTDLQKVRRRIFNTYDQPQPDYRAATLPEPTESTLEHFDEERQQQGLEYSDVDLPEPTESELEHFDEERQPQGLEYSDVDLPEPTESEIEYFNDEPAKRKRNDVLWKGYDFNTRHPKIQRLVPKKRIPQVDHLRQATKRELVENIWDSNKFKARASKRSRKNLEEGLSVASYIPTGSKRLHGRETLTNPKTKKIRSPLASNLHDRRYRKRKGEYTLWYNDRYLAVPRKKVKWSRVKV